MAFAVAAFHCPKAGTATKQPGMPIEFFGTSWSRSCANKQAKAKHYQAIRLARHPRCTSASTPHKQLQCALHSLIPWSRLKNRACGDSVKPTQGQLNSDDIKLCDALLFPSGCVRQQANLVPVAHMYGRCRQHQAPARFAM
jgi:hypothetical protein